MTTVEVSASVAPSEMSPRRRSAMLIPLVVVAALGAGAGLATASDGRRAVHDVEGEPASARAVTAEREFASGRTSAGDVWTAVSYETAGGHLCVDIHVAGPSTGQRDGSAGGCFLQSSASSQQAVGSIAGLGEKFVYGRLQGERGSDGGRSVDVEFADGRVVQATTFHEGVFILLDTSDPVRISYSATDGTKWSHAYFESRP